MMPPNGNRKSTAHDMIVAWATLTKLKFAGGKI